MEIPIELFRTIVWVLFWMIALPLAGLVGIFLALARIVSRRRLTIWR